MPAKCARIRYLLTFVFLLTCSFVFAQKTVTGKVFGNDKEPLVGATVQVKGASTITQTNLEGFFSIVVSTGATTLVISNVGYETMQVPVTDTTSNITVSLKTQASGINEVVVVGYTSQRKRDITGAVTVVNVSEMKVQPTVDPQSQLQGRASGVNVIQTGVPGEGATVRIRGLGSFTNNNPVYVVDGVQAGSITGLNPNDIESMQVLKDAASASIYGVRATNGVVVITTKKAKTRGVKVAYDMFYGVQNPGNGQPFLNAQEQADLLFLAKKNSGLSTKGSVFGDGATPVLPDYIYYTGADNNGKPIMNGNAGVDPKLYKLDYGRLGDAGYSPYIIVPTSKGGTDWYKEATQNAPIQSHNLSLSNATESSRFMLSLNYFNQQAITKYQFYKRYTARLNSEFSVFKFLRVGENLQVLGAQKNTGNVGQGEASVLAQISRSHSIIPAYTINSGDFAGTAGGSGFGTWGNGKNPVAMLYRAKNDRGYDLNLFGNMYAELDVLKNITLRTSFGGAINNANSFEYPFIEYEHVENNANKTYKESYYKSFNWIWTNQVTYKKALGLHNIAILAATEAQSGGRRQLLAASTGFYTYNYLPYISLSNGDIQNLGGSYSEPLSNTQSYFGRADYNYDGKYLAAVSFRRDGSSKFSSSKRYGNYTSFSLGWVLSSESFLKEVKWMDFLKIRGGYGLLGNDAAASLTNSYTTFGSNRQSSWYDINGAQNSPQEGFYLSFVGNPNGGWEKSAQTNIGFDATLFKNTEIVFDWYKKETRDLLYNPAGQGIAGAASSSNPAFRNVGNMSNTGIDLMISNRAGITKDLRLNTTVTFTTYKNKITTINGDQKFFEFNSTNNEANRIGGSATRNLVGEALNTYYGYKVIGLFQTKAEADAWNQKGAGPGRFKYADMDGDKKIDEKDRTIIGNPNPKFTYGLNLGVEYKAFDLAMFFYGAQGKDAFNFTRWFTDFSSGFPGGRSKRALYESWLPDGSRPNAKTPIQESVAVGGGFSTSGVVNSYYVEDASYLRLRNLQMGYTLPTAISSKAHISKARLYVQGTNLFTITKYSGLNPDIISNDDRAAGVDVGAYPTVKQFLIGASIVF